jgi:long-chain fatty acid transport protein
MYVFISINFDNWCQWTIFARLTKTLNMKKALMTLSFIALTYVVLAGGIVHNTNQSASFIRMPARDASLGIDATYYNPAGLTFLRDGFHISLNNQYITQTRNIKSTFPNMNRNEFEGGVTAPLFPSAYAVYKKNRLAVSFGFNPIGGGGSAKFEDGLPSFEMQPSMIPGALTAGGVPTSAYSFDTEFEGSSIIYGFQGGLSYQIHDEISVFVGARYVMVSNAYSGYLRNIQINPTFPAMGYDGSMRSAPTFFSDFSGYLTTVAGTLQGTGQNLQPIIDGGGGSVPLANGTMAGLTPEQVALLQGTITQLGGDPANMTIAHAQQFFYGASAGYAANAEQMANNSQATRDMEVDATQSGSGIVPIIGVNLKFAENFSMGIKYEFKTKINVKNSTTVDDVGLYPDGLEVPGDMPAMLSIGMRYAPVQRLTLHAGVHHYFDRKVSYGKRIGNEFESNMQFMDTDFMEAAFGLEFAISEKFLISAGYLRTQTGVKEIYQSDLSHSLSTNSLGGGFRFNFNENFGLNLGVMNTWYLEDTRDFGPYMETYNRKAFVAALGIDLSF